MKNLLLFLSVLISGLFFISCGDPNLDITEVQYEPKLVVQGYLFPGRPVENIRVYRNFPLNRQLDTTSLFAANVQVTINNMPLKFNPFTFSYYHDTLLVREGVTYTLRASGVVDGRQLETAATTTVPSSRFRLLKKAFGDVRYDTDIPVRLIPECSSRFYAFSIRPDTASLSNFIFDNHYVPNIKAEDISEQLNAFVFQFGMILHVQPSSTDTLEHKIRGLNTWFYGSYKAIMYAGDDNFRNFFLTSKNVQELDGNFHEPVEHLSGDGIGVFASAIVDTVTFRIRP